MQLRFSINDLQIKHRYLSRKGWVCSHWPIPHSMSKKSTRRNYWNMVLYVLFHDSERFIFQEAAEQELKSQITTLKIDIERQQVNFITLL